MMKRIILCALCLMMVFSACLAEELPAKATCYKIKLNRNIPAETMREVFAEYMVPGCEVEYDEYRASCPDLINGGTGCFLTYPEIEESEQVNGCREIAEKLLHTVYPDQEPELISAMPLRDNLLHDLYDFDTYEWIDGRWYFLGQEVTHELEGVLKAAYLAAVDSRKQIEEMDPSWILLQYHPGPVDGLRVGMNWPDSDYNMPYCMSTFIFDGEKNLITAYLGGSFTMTPGKETEIRITKEEALQLAREHNAKENVTGDRGFEWDERMSDADVYTLLLKTMGYSSLRSEMVLEEDSGRLVMAVNRKGQMVPAWEFAESYSVVADGKVIKEHQFATDYYFYLSAEDGTLINQ